MIALLKWCWTSNSLELARLIPFVDDIEVVARLSLPYDRLVQLDADRFEVVTDGFDFSV